MERIVAIDPGDSCGWALALSTDDSDSVYQAGVLPFDEMCDRLNTWLTMGEGDWANFDGKAIDAVVIEDWRLREPEKFRGSDMPTSQQLGALRYIVRRFGGYEAILLDPWVKKPIAGRLRANGIRAIRPDGLTQEMYEHCKDAQLLAYAYLMRRSLPAGQPVA